MKRADAAVRPAHELFANFIIAGVPKAGTSSVHRWLSDHPDVVGSIEKETYFFVDPGSHMFRAGCNSATDLDGYADHFRHASGQERVRVEATPAYIYYTEALAKIPSLPTEPRCLFIVREPAAQIHSLFRYFQNNWNWIPADMGFRDYIRAVRDGGASFGGNELAQHAVRNAIYVDFLERWHAKLGSDRFRVETFDALSRHPGDFMKRLSHWLGLAPTFYDDYSFPRENETYTVRNQTLQWVNIALRARLPRGRVYEAARGLYRSLNTTRPQRPDADDAEVIADLRAEFRPHNRRLEAAFGLDLSGW